MSEPSPEQQPSPPPVGPRPWTRRQRVLAGIGIVGMLAIGIGTSLGLLILFPPSPSDAEMITRILRMGRLGKLPADAAQVETGGTNTPFAMDLLLRFAAPPGQIQQFLDDSPGLEGAPAEVLNPRHRFQPFPADGQGDPAHRHYLPDPRHAWWDPLVQTRGRYFETATDADGVRTQVIVDDEADEVFIRVRRGDS